LTAPDSREAFALVLGRACLDLYADDVGIPLSGAERFTAYLGGSPANVAAGLARLGANVRFATRVASDPTGAFVRARLRSFGIDTEFVRDDPTAQTSVVLAAFQPPDDSELVFYRDRAADLALAPGDVDAAVLRAAALLVTTGTGLSAEPSRQATLDALSLAGEGAARRAFIVDHRPAAWAGTDAAEVARHYRAALRACDVAIGNAAEIAIASETVDWSAGARAIAALGPAIVVVTMGANGAAVLCDGELTLVPALPASAVNVVGAGDGFAAAFLHGLLTGRDPVESARLGAAGGAIVAERHGCSAAMPTRRELDLRLAYTRTNGHP
jgi:5-dehydro-2-deoxygluconokinase